jgi:hypothetical protein
MIKDKYRTTGKLKNFPVRRYVRKSKDGYTWCERSEKDKRYDVAQGTCDGEDLPLHIKEVCDAYSGYFYACEWPLS